MDAVVDIQNLEYPQRGPCPWQFWNLAMNRSLVQSLLKPLYLALYCLFWAFSLLFALLTFPLLLVAQLVAGQSRGLPVPLWLAQAFALVWEMLDERLGPVEAEQLELEDGLQKQKDD